MRMHVLRGRSGGGSVVRYFPGLSLILAGLLILAFPQILVLLIASVFFFFGAIALSLAWRMRKLENTEIVMEDGAKRFDPFTDWFPL